MRLQGAEVKQVEDFVLGVNRHWKVVKRKVSGVTCVNKKVVRAAMLFVHLR